MPEGSAYSVRGQNGAEGPNLGINDNDDDLVK
jgi:hypothetical protein